MRDDALIQHTHRWMPAEFIPLENVYALPDFFQHIIIAV